MAEYQQPQRSTTACDAGAVPISWPTLLPFLWSQVLFPGLSRPPRRFHFRHFFVLLVLPSVLLYPCLSFYLFEPDEGRYAEIPREMLERGDWIVPYLQDEPYLDKPPLLYWLVMASFRVFGVHDWAARLVPALAMHACVLATYLLGRRHVGERAAFWGALVLMLTPGFLGVGRLLLMDGLLALWIAMSLLLGMEAMRGRPVAWRWWVASALICGLGILTKGPVALLLVLPPLWLHRRLTGQRGIGARAFLAFVALSGAVAAPWYVAVCLCVPEFAHHFLWYHNVVRFVTPFDHQEPVWYYVPILLLGLLPWTFLLPSFARFLGTARSETRRERSPELGFLFLAMGWCVLFFSLSGCKLPTYILPAYVPLALLLGSFVSQVTWRRSRALWTFVGLGIAVQSVGHFILVPWYAEYRSPLHQWQALQTACGERAAPVVCYPRYAHSVAFYLNREDMRNFRSKEIDQMRAYFRQQPRTVVLLTHRHSLHGLRQALPPEMHILQAAHFGLQAPAGLSETAGQRVNRWLGETALGLCDLAIVVNPRASARPSPQCPSAPK